GDEPIETLLPADDVFARAVHGRVATLAPDEQRAALEVITCLSSVPDGPRPTKAWRTKAATMLGGTPGASEEVRFLLESLASTPAGRTEREHYGGAFTTPSWLAVSSLPLARGAVWAGLIADEPWIGDAVQAVAQVASRNL